MPEDDDRTLEFVSNWVGKSEKHLKAVYTTLVRGTGLQPSQLVEVWRSLGDARMTFRDLVQEVTCQTSMPSVTSQKRYSIFEESVPDNSPTKSLQLASKQQYVLIAPNLEQT